MAMKITLRKANALQKAIQDIMNSVEVTPRININEFQDPVEAINTAARKLLDNDVRRSDLLMALFTIRTLTGTMNSNSGISMRLSHAAYLDKRIAQLQPLVASSAEVENIAVVSGKLDKIRNRPADSRASIYGHHDEVDTGVLSVEQVENIRNVISELKKQKQQVNDEVLELNVRTEFELTDEVEAVLQREKLV
jgi:uncharacterized protein YdcH (DUF465 family)